MDSTDDERITNNIMRHKYKVLSEIEKDRMKKIKDMGLEFTEYVDVLSLGREGALAKTKIEKAVMWAIKGLTK